MTIESAVNIPNASGTTQTVKDIASRLPDAETPFEFLQKIVNGDSPVQKVETKTTNPNPTQKITTPHPEIVNSTVKVEEPPKVEEKKDELNIFDEEKTEEVKTEPVVNDEEDDTQPITLKDNYKRLKTSHKETKAKVKEYEDLLTQTKEELETYKTGIALPDVIKDYEEKNKELEKYRDIYAIDTSPELRAKHIEPINIEREKLISLAKEYEYEDPEAFADQALGLKGQELGNFLSEHLELTDAVEAKQYVKTARSHQDEILRIKQEKPGEVLKQLREEAARAQDAETKIRNQNISRNASSAWNKSYQKLVEEKKFIELIEDPNDPEFTENFVKPLKAKAGQEYGKIIRELAGLGLKELPEGLAEALSTMSQWAHAARVIVDSRNSAIEKAENIQRANNFISKYDRPSLGQSMGVPGGGSSRDMSQASGTDRGTDKAREKTAEELIAFGRQYARSQK